MLEFLETTTTRAFGLAEVLETEPAGDRVLVRIPGSTDGARAWARIAVADPRAGRVGATALVAGDPTADLFVIGVLAAADRRERIALGDGGFAEVDATADRPRLRVASGKADFTVELDPEKGRARVVVDSGDLAFATRSGDITFDSARSIRMKGRDVVLAGRRSAEVSAGTPKRRAALRLEPDRAGLSGREFDLVASKAVCRVLDMDFVGERMRARLERVNVVAELLETTARTIVSKAKDVFRTVSGLVQQRAGRKRTLVDGAWVAKSRKASFRSEKDFRVDGDRIYLG